MTMKDSWIDLKKFGMINDDSVLTNKWVLVNPINLDDQ